MPEADSEKMKKALEWFYNTSTSQSSYDADQSLNALNELFGYTASQDSTMVTTGFVENSSEVVVESACLDNTDEYWEIYCPKDFSSK